MIITKRIFALIALCLSLSLHTETSLAATTNNVVSSNTILQPQELRWKLQNKQRIAYQADTYSIPATDANQSLAALTKITAGKASENNHVILMAGLPSKNVQVAFLSLPDTQSKMTGTNSTIHTNFLAMVKMFAEIAPTGETTSFWLPSPERNFINVLFALPTQPVAVGDTWPLPMTMLRTRSSICVTCSKNNTATLASLVKDSDGDIIATIHLSIKESFIGKTIATNKAEQIGTAPAELNISIDGEQVFDVTQGRLLSETFKRINKNKDVGDSTFSQECVFDKLTYMQKIPDVLQNS